ncbi:MAG: polysaccharide biosynthesis/export family protein [Bacteroidia bacterium]|nr:polysaccharide biosynthesis/export family protein [Bacteroidia bacterium]MBP7261017.1 polysaccharide biosynthesis/export family protein [Bacteroidia bacterium]MBP9724336.1 polysaccharide biosynthesis/export family protein [Bacteroidia bacterium]
MKRILPNAVWAIVLIITFSCNTSKNIMFKTTEVITVAKTDSLVYKHRIKPDDRIIINFLNNYDLEKNNLMSTTAADLEQKSFLVNYDGTVTLPIIGRTMLVGLTRLEAAQRLETLYSKYIINPIIDVSIVNLSVSVLGEVKMPGTYKLDKENTNLVEVLAMAGGATEFGKVYKVKIIRGNLKSPQIIEVDLGEASSLKRTDIIIQDKDIIYVEPMKNKLRGSAVAVLNPYFIIITSISTLIIAFSAIK